MDCVHDQDYRLANDRVQVTPIEKQNTSEHTSCSKCVFIDSDAIALKNCDELFDYPELSAVPDMSWTDIFNSGVFVFEPNEQTYQDLLVLTERGVSFDKADQGLLNVYFSNWFNEKDKHLSYIYNVSTLACYSYPAAYEK